jgi:hypothetical protein
MILGLWPMRTICRCLLSDESAGRANGCSAWLLGGLHWVEVDVVDRRGGADRRKPKRDRRR